MEEQSDTIPKKKTHGGTWETTRSCCANDLISVSAGLQCMNCGAYTPNLGVTWYPRP